LLIRPSFDLMAFFRFSKRPVTQSLEAIRGALRNMRLYAA
jgi:hypothetical protein